MKNLQSLFIYLLAAICAWALSGARGCEKTSTVLAPPIVLRDTTTVWDLLPVETVKIRKILIRDTVYLYHPAPYVPGQDAEMLLVEPDRSDSLTLYAGEIAGEACTYRYTAAVQADSLHFLAIESRCQSVVPLAASSRTDAPAARLSAPARMPLCFGLKAGWTYGDSRMSHIGAQVAWNGAYGAVNHLPGSNRWTFEAGVLWPLRRSPKPLKPLRSITDFDP